MNSTTSRAPTGKSSFAFPRASISLFAATAALCSAAAQGPGPSDPYAQIVLTSPSIQDGSPVTLTGFSTSAAPNEPSLLSIGPNLCGLNSIVEQVDTIVSPQFFTLMFAKTLIPSMTITLTQSNLEFQPIYHEISLTDVTVKSITRSDYFNPLSPPAASVPPGYLYETITLQATSYKYTYQPVSPIGQLAGAPATVSGSCGAKAPAG